MPAVPPGLPSSNLVLMLQTQESPPRYNAVANLGDFAGPAQSTTSVDVSKHGDKFTAYVATLIDSGVLTCPVWFDPSQPTLAGNPQALAELLQSRSLESWLVTFVDDTGTITDPQFTFNAYVTKLSFKMPVKGVYSADGEFRTTGGLTYLWTSTVMPAGQALP